ncbi:surfeit locus protein 6-domain-containing protein [Scenedesmus sp. NREL 46B-D3]|nr:surfeit locus protein 6-domain-containing protein [Scenedesmus sp. NREL 46B-D3]
MSKDGGRGSTSSGHCRFFDYLADLVDPKFYHADDREHINPKYMKHAERTATKRAFKEQYKQNKRAKLDPDAVKTTTQLHKKQAQEAAERQAAGEPAGGLAGLGTLHLSAGGQPSREELLHRLHAKMELCLPPARLRAGPQRAGAGEGRDKQAKGAADNAKQWRQEQLGRKLKGKQQQQPGQKQQQQQQQQQPAAGRCAETGKGRAAAAGQQQQQQQQGAGLAFNKLQLDTGRPGTGRKGGKGKQTKAEALKAAEDKQARLADATARHDKEAIAAEAWRAALARASGERVLDDPKLLRRSLKREAQDKQRKAKRWAERNSAQQEQQKARQDKRKDNLAARSTAKLEKKKERRDKKLLRAGFEGRKSGFINAPKGGGAK